VKIEILVKNRIWLKNRNKIKQKKIGEKSKFWSKIEILVKNRIWLKNRNIGEKSKFWSKIEILVKNRNLVEKSKYW